MAASDLVIRGGTIVDGTGQPAFVGDIAVTCGLISAVGPNLNVRGLREYDATGSVVAPGWIDGHTHFDAQVTWDPYLSPSTSNGVTTCIFGNCGIGFAPCQQDRRAFLSHLVEAVEDIPGRVIAEGMVWDWETFEEYMDSLSKRELACDVGLMIGHSAVRAWVMGKRANVSDMPGGPQNDPVLPHEIEAMAALVQDAVASGAMGFSTSRFFLHRDKSGFLTPGSLAAREEVLAMARSVANAGGGIFQFVGDFSTFDDVPMEKRDPNKVLKHNMAELDWMKAIAHEHGDQVTISWTIGHGRDDANATKVMLAMQFSFLEAVRKSGGLAVGGTFVRPQGQLWGFGARLHPFLMSRAFREVQKLCKQRGEELTTKLRVPDIRSQILKETEEAFLPSSLAKNPGMREFASSMLPWSLVYRWTPHYEPGKEESIKSIALQEGREPLHVVYDLLLSEKVLWKPMFSWATRDHEPIHKLLHHPQIVPAADDAGAHATLITEASSPSHLLTHWVRDRTKGPKMTLEHAIKKQTQEVANLYKLRDRGVIAVGKKADLNVIDLEKLRIQKPYYVEDLPMNAGRWLQDVVGYRLTLVSGVETWKDGKPTGALPGRLVRNPCRKAEAWSGVAWKVSGALEQAGPKAPGSNRAHALRGSGSGGASAVGRVLRDTVESDTSQEARSRL